MPCALVNAQDCLLGGTGRKAEDLARLGIEPRALEVDALVPLNREVAVVRLPELVSGHAEEPCVDVHELAHRPSPLVIATPWDRRPCGHDRRPESRRSSGDRPICPPRLTDTRAGSDGE